MSPLGIFLIFLLSFVGLSYQQTTGAAPNATATVRPGAKPNAIEQGMAVFMTFVEAGKQWLQNATEAIKQMFGGGESMPIALPGDAVAVKEETTARTKRDLSETPKREKRNPPEWDDRWPAPTPEETQNQMRPRWKRDTDDDEDDEPETGEKREPHRSRRSLTGDVSRLQSHPIEELGQFSKKKRAISENEELLRVVRDVSIPVLDYELSGPDLTEEEKAAQNARKKRSDDDALMDAEEERVKRAVTQKTQSKDPMAPTKEELAAQGKRRKRNTAVEAEKPARRVQPKNYSQGLSLTPEKKESETSKSKRSAIREDDGHRFNAVASQRFLVN